MRVSEFASRLGLSRDTVKRLERRGVLTPTRDRAGHRRFTEEDVDRTKKVLFHETRHAESATS